MKFNHQTARLLVGAGLVLGVVASHAQYSGGVYIQKDQETMVKIGMTPAEVQQALGRPGRVSKFRNEPGPTWTYQVSGSASDRKLIDVDFDADNKVESVSERVEHLGGD